MVDITNYVMLELGQPMHAFDYDTIKGHKIIVERAKEGESFTTLDGVEHELSDSILCIKDGGKKYCLRRNHGRREFHDYRSGGECSFGGGLL